MPSISKDEAVNRLTRELEQNTRADDLVEVYNELFPTDPTTEEAANRDARPLADRVAAHLKQGLEIEEIVSLWNVVFPGHRNVQFDEDEGTLNFDRKHARTRSGD